MTERVRDDKNFIEEQYVPEVCRLHVPPRSLAELPRCTVLVVRGHTDGGVPHIEKFWQIVDGRCVEIGQGLDEYRAFARNWYDRVDKLSPPSR